MVLVVHEPTERLLSGPGLGRSDQTESLQRLSRTSARRCWLLLVSADREATSEIQGCDNLTAPAASNQALELSNGKCAVDANLTLSRHPFLTSGSVRIAKKKRNLEAAAIDGLSGSSI